jgi:hypothetical protein
MKLNDLSILSFLKHGIFGVSCRISCFSRRRIQACYFNESGGMRLVKFIFGKQVLILTTNLIVVQVASLCHNTWLQNKTPGRCSSHRQMVVENTKWQLQKEDQQDPFDVIHEQSLRAEEGWDDGEISRSYRRDPEDDLNIPVADAAGLRNLLADRFEARKRKEFDRVHKIDAVLKEEHSVRAYDNPNVWTRQTKPPAAFLRRRTRKTLETFKEQFGPTAHPYTQVGGPIDPVTCSLAPTKVHDLLFQMQHCRLEGRYEEADAVRFELMLHGVQITEPTKTWRADGTKSLGDPPSPTMKKSPSMAPTYSEHLKSSPDPKIRPSTLRRVAQLLSMRADSLVREESNLAKFLELELYKTYGVGVDDPSGTFFFGPSSVDEIDWQPPALPCEQMDSSANTFPDLLFVSESKENAVDNYQVRESTKYNPNGHVRRRIEHLVLERIVKRDEGKFYEAEAISKELYSTYAVALNDDTREWTVVS